MGGSFDPIHLGHLRGAESAREALNLQSVLLMPAARAPHKPEPAASDFDRFTMVALAASGHPNLVPGDAELRRGGTSYTVDTLERLQLEQPDAELFLIVGSDTLPDLVQWRSVTRLLALAELAVVTRPEAPPLEVPAALPSARVRAVQGTGLRVSSTRIRALAAEGRSLRYLVPDGVADYIQKRGLYR